MLLTTTLRLMSIRGQVAEVNCAQSTNNFGRPVAFPCEIRLQLVDKSQNVMKEADAIKEVTFYIGLLHRSPTLLHCLGRRERVVDTLLPIEVDSRGAILHRVLVPHLDAVVSHFDPQKGDLGLEEIGHEAAARVFIVESLAQLMQGP